MLHWVWGMEKHMIVFWMEGWGSGWFKMILEVWKWLVMMSDRRRWGGLSDVADLDILRLLDWRPELFSEWQKGCISGVAGVAQDGMDQDVFDVDHVPVGAGRKAAFAIYEAPADEYTHHNL